jgi:hypothetical protein
MDIRTYYQATDQQGRPTGKFALTKVLSWVISLGLTVLWALYLLHLDPDHDPILSVGELGAISLGGIVAVAVLYYAGRRLGEIGVQAAEKWFGRPPEEETDAGT